MLFLVAKTQTFIIAIIADPVIIMKGGANSTTGRAFGYCSTLSKYMQNRRDLLGQDFDGDECLWVSRYFLLESPEQQSLHRCQPQPQPGAEKAAP